MSHAAFIETGARPARTEPPAARPPFKWLGGKRRLAAAILKHAPPTFGRYLEPFAGGAAVFFALRPKRAMLADTNARLVRTYRALRDNVAGVIELLETYPYEEAFYESMRAKDVDRGSDVDVAAWFLYVNRAGFNGLYRVNRSGEFNVPFGRYTNPTICDRENLHACSVALKTAVFKRADFETVADLAKPGDLVYFDPPYVPVSKTSSFTAYAADGFTDDDQVRLRDVAEHLVARRVHVLLTNSSAPRVRELYARPHFDIVRLAAPRSVSAKTAGRGKVTDLLIRGRVR